MYKFDFENDTTGRQKIEPMITISIAWDWIHVGCDLPICFEVNEDYHEMYLNVQPKLNILRLANSTGTFIFHNFSMTFHD